MARTYLGSTALDPPDNVVRNTGNETIAGTKTFSSDLIIPDEAYDATNWNGVLEPPTKNAVRDKLVALVAQSVTNGNTSTVPSEDAVFDAIAALSGTYAPLLQGKRLGSATITSNQSGITSIADITSLSVAVTAVAGQRLRIAGNVRMSAAQSSGSSSATRGLVTIWRDSTQIGAIGDVAGMTTSAQALQNVGAGFVLDTPGAGSFTYKVRGQAIGTGASLTIEASSTAPSSVAVYDDGP